MDVRCPRSRHRATSRACRAPMATSRFPPMWTTFRREPRCRWCCFRPLSFNGVADVLDGFADFALGCAESALNLAAGFLCLTFGLQILVICKVAGRLLGLPLQLFCLALDFVTVPHGIVLRP